MSVDQSRNMNKDARRYRFLRERGGIMKAASGSSLTGDELDRVIDLAQEAELRGLDKVSTNS